MSNVGVSKSIESNRERERERERPPSPRSFQTRGERSLAFDVKEAFLLLNDNARKNKRRDCPVSPSVAVVVRVGTPFYVSDARARIGEN